MTNPTTDLIDRLAGSSETTLLVPLLRLIAQGDPVALDDLATAIGLTVEEVHARLAAMPDTEYDAQGLIIGQGLTLRPTRHRFTVAGEELYTWCALDTLIFPALLDRPARVESTSPAGGGTIRVAVDSTSGVTSVEPATAVVSLVGVGDAPSLRSSFCNQVHYFTSPEDAAGWLTEHPSGRVIPVAEAFDLGRTLLPGMLDGAAIPAAASCCEPGVCC
jgi:alkylmercury lyase